MIKATCGAEDIWTPWAYFNERFAAGIATASFSSTVTVQYSPVDREEKPGASDITVPVKTFTTQDVQNIIPPARGGWFRIGIATGDYTDDVDVFMQGR